MPAKKKNSSEPTPESFEGAADELEEITRRLEQEPTSLTDLLRDFERGQILLKFCQDSLKSARERLDLVEAKMQTEPLEEDPDDSSDDDPDTYDDDVRLF